MALNAINSFNALNFVDAFNFFNAVDLVYPITLLNAVHAAFMRAASTVFLGKTLSIVDDTTRCLS